MPEHNSIIEANVKDNSLLIHFITSTTNRYEIYLNSQLIETITVTGEYEYKYSLTNVFTRYLKIKIISDKDNYEKNINRNINSYGEGLKKTLLGKNNQFFLINDKNQEIRQHYDPNYSSNLNINKLKQSIKSKIDYFKVNDIKYGFYVIPDKSVTLRKYLPFETEKAKRNVDSLSSVVSDLLPIINEEDTLSNDTHISEKSSLKIVPYILSQLYDESYDYFRTNLESLIVIYENEHKGDLFATKNWSYQRGNPLFIKNHIISTESVRAKNDYKKISTDRIPRKYRYVASRQSQYFYNEKSLLNKKAVIIHDSSTKQLSEAFISIYREVFFYWDHWYFNKDLINWFKPDDVIEIRTERFLENPLCPLITDDYRIRYPIYPMIESFDADSDRLLFKLSVMDYCQNERQAIINVFLDDKSIRKEKIMSSFYMDHSLKDYSYGEHKLKVVLTDEYGRQYVLEKEFPLYEKLDSEFKDLKMSYKGIGDTFFRVNDRNNELLQHYDKMYRPRIDINKFRDSYLSKKLYLKSRNIDYAIFAITDKSIVLSDCVPFRIDNVIRIIDRLPCVHDLKEVISGDDYLLNDSNLSGKSCIGIVAHILNKLYPDRSAGEYEKDIMDRVVIVESKHNGNLFTNKAWSYDDELKEKYYTILTEDVCVKDEYIKVKNEDIPLDSRKFSNYKSQYFINHNALLDKKAIILHDTSINPFIQPLIASFKEVFFYNDQWFFNKHILDWFDADIIIELREECSFENPVYPIVSEIDEVVLPINVKIDRFEVIDNNLLLDFEAYDLKNLPVSTECSYLLDNSKIASDRLLDGKSSLIYDISHIKSGKHSFSIHIEKSITTKTTVITKTLDVD